MGRLLSAVLACLGFGAFFSVAHAEHAWVDGSGNPYHWARTANPFTLKLGNNVSSAWIAYLNAAPTNTDWGFSTVLDLEVVTGGTTADPRKCRPTTGRVEVCSASYGGAWLGVAQIWISGSHIYQATTKVNDFYFNKPKYNKPEWRSLVICQEIGHTFGLDHQDENFSNLNRGSCMDYTSYPLGPPSNEHPNSHDYEQLATIYNAHKDSTTSASQASASKVPPAAMNEIDFEGPGQWGKLVRSTHAGRLELYELDFGGGHKIFTFVIWPEEEDRGRGKPR